MGKKLEEFRDRNMSRKEKRKEKQEKFKQEHPKLYDLKIKAEAVGLTAVVFGVPFVLGWMTKHDNVTNWAKITNERLDDMLTEMGRPNADYVDDEGKYHQDLHFGAYAVWESKEAYLDAEKQRLDSLPDGYPR